MRPTSFFLNTTESRNRELYVFPMPFPKAFEADKRKRRFRCYFLIKKDIEHINTGWIGWAATTSDAAFEVVFLPWHMGGRSDLRERFRLVFPVKETILETYSQMYGREDAAYMLYKSQELQKLYVSFLKKIKPFLSASYRGGKFRIQLQKQQIFGSLREEMGEFLDMQIDELTAKDRTSDSSINRESCKFCFRKETVRAGCRRNLDYWQQRWICKRCHRTFVSEPRIGGLKDNFPMMEKIAQWYIDGASLRQLSAKVTKEFGISYSKDAILRALSYYEKEAET